MSDADSITRKEAIAEVVRLRSEVAYLTFNRDHLAAANKSMHAELVALRAALEDIERAPINGAAWMRMRAQKALHGVATPSATDTASEGHSNG